jgi:hypothetical protein
MYASDDGTSLGGDGADGDAADAAAGSSTSTVIADVTVKFITICDISMPFRGSHDKKKWKMMRVFNWTFSSELSRGCDELEWRVSEVGATGWD